MIIGFCFVLVDGYLSSERWVLGEYPVLGLCLSSWVIDVRSYIYYYYIIHIHILLYIIYYIIIYYSSPSSLPSLFYLPFQILPPMFSSLSHLLHSSSQSSFLLFPIIPFISSLLSSFPLSFQSSFFPSIILPRQSFSQFLVHIWLLLDYCSYLSSSLILRILVESSRHIFIFWWMVEVCWNPFGVYEFLCFDGVYYSYYYYLKLLSSSNPSSLLFYPSLSSH